MQHLGDSEYSKQYIERPIVSKSSGAPWPELKYAEGEWPNADTPAVQLVQQLPETKAFNSRVFDCCCWSVYSRPEYSCSYLLAHLLEHTDCHVCILLLCNDGCAHLTKQMQLKHGTGTSMYDEPGACEEVPSFRFCLDVSADIEYFVTFIA